MKRTTSLLIPLCLLYVLLGCKTDKDVLPNWFAQGWGQASALANKNNWDNIASSALLVKGQFSKQPELTVQVFKFSKDGFLRGLVQLTLIPQQMNGQYTLTNDTANCNNKCVLANYYTYQDDGDVNGSVYTLDVSQANYLKVITYDSANKKIAGEFRAAFIKGASYNNADPDVILLENGTFNTPIGDKGRFE